LMWRHAPDVLAPPLAATVASVVASVAGAVGSAALVVAVWSMASRLGRRLARAPAAIALAISPIPVVLALLRAVPRPDPPVDLEAAVFVPRSLDGAGGLVLAAFAVALCVLLAGLRRVAGASPTKDSAAPYRAPHVMAAAVVGRSLVAVRLVASTRWTALLAAIATVLGVFAMLRPATLLCAATVLVAAGATTAMLVRHGSSLSHATRSLTLALWFAVASAVLALGTLAAHAVANSSVEDLQTIWEKTFPWLWGAGVFLSSALACLAHAAGRLASRMPGAKRSLRVTLAAVFLAVPGFVVATAWAGGKLGPWAVRLYGPLLEGVAYCASFPALIVGALCLASASRRVG
jgi:hypothetical protein